ncbi:2-phospho-L-lactate guanylyltransferase [Allosaccharopolyspora coralli]|uniref:Phosphoenolpyruvate guanylyltransferase n=1 Tax=Allosaccharopolyspora coralli TaxID=2665642 RepID=A0A5Q3QB60_9PSEU|nr:2-phospho-L-lactate guanylyltransferase [Allosaccharopolyspora coralli]QGK71090.1 2-phospho-L-lactate guanylyltransferase [Allosaccharopolyspora coralli]
MTAVQLLVPIKPLSLAKSRLTGLSLRGGAHADLVLACARDTVAAARAADGVADVAVVTTDPAVAAAFEADGVPVVPELSRQGLNAALLDAETGLRDRAERLGALQADLPALRPSELAGALRRAGDDRAFCADRHGTGTTLLLAAPGERLTPAFGAGSAGAHLDSGAKPLDGPWESLRCDVDTAVDLAAAAALGLGPRTRALYAG